MQFETGIVTIYCRGHGRQTYQRTVLTHHVSDANQAFLMVDLFRITWNDTKSLVLAKQSLNVLRVIRSPTWAETLYSDFHLIRT